MSPDDLCAVICDGGAFAVARLGGAWIRGRSVAERNLG